MSIIERELERIQPSELKKEFAIFIWLRTSAKLFYQVIRSYR